MLLYIGKSWFLCNIGPVELAILLDQSGELKNLNNFNMMKSFIKKLAREFELGNKKTKIGIISFTDTNLQLFDLHSYHDGKNIDAQIDRLNYEGIKANSGALNKALDAAQANLFTGVRELSVPRLLLVFDTAAKKDGETEAKGTYEIHLYGFFHMEFLNVNLFIF
jgi:hypothetical protein